MVKVTDLYLGGTQIKVIIDITDCDTEEKKVHPQINGMV